MTAGTALRASLTIPGQAERVRYARRFVTRAMGDGHPCAEVAALLATEVVTNSVQHSGSGLPGGTVTVTVTDIPGGVRVEVLDAGGASVPHVRGTVGVDAEGGRGLRLVRDLSASWGYRREDAGVVTWFEVCADAAPATGPGLPETAALGRVPGTATCPHPVASCERAGS